jgi:cytochrome c556
MIRIICAVVGVAIGTTAVVAQSDVLNARKSMMKKNSQHAKAINEMVKGEKPFDPAVVTAAFTVWSDTASALPKQFPDDSKGGDTRALPKIWSDRAGFEAQIASFGKAAAAGKANASNLESLKASFSAVSKACTDCHEGYRAAAKK